MARILMAIALLTLIPTVAPAQNYQGKYAIQTSKGYFLTAVGGGGKTGAGCIASDRKTADANSWEVFEFVHVRGDWYAIKAPSGHYLTANGGGNQMGKETIFSDATQINNWEMFRVIPLRNGAIAIQTPKGGLVSILDGGGRHDTHASGVIHTDLRFDPNRVPNWEQLNLLKR